MRVRVNFMQQQAKRHNRDYPQIMNPDDERESIAESLHLPINSVQLCVQNWRMKSAHIGNTLHSPTVTAIPCNPPRLTNDQKFQNRGNTYRCYDRRMEQHSHNKIDSTTLLTPKSIPSGYKSATNNDPPTCHYFAKKRPFPPHLSHFGSSNERQFKYDPENVKADERI